MSEKHSPDVYPNGASVVEKLEWHERRREAAHEALDKLGMAGLFNWLLEDRIKRLTMEFAAANSEIEKLTKELDEAQKQIKDLQGSAVDLFSARDNAIAERDAARALNQELKTELNHALVELHQARANTRSEPSRLEIAVDLMAANLSRETNEWYYKEEAIWALEQADALIAMAKEGK